MRICGFSFPIAPVNNFYVHLIGKKKQILLKLNYYFTITLYKRKQFYW